MLKFRKRFRQLNPKFRSLSGFISSKKLKTDVQFESSLERDFILLQEFNQEVYGFIEQPFLFTEKYMPRKVEKFSYTPDFLISYFEPQKRNEIVEIKYSDDPRLGDEKYKLKLSYMKEFCNSIDIDFNIYTEIDIRILNHDYLENIKFLYTYRHAFENEKFLKDRLKLISRKVSIMLQRLRELEKTSIAEYLNEVAKKEDYEGEYLFYLWYLIANNFILCDLQVPLSNATIIWRD